MKLYKSISATALSLALLSASLPCVAAVAAVAAVATATAAAPQAPPNATAPGTALQTTPPAQAATAPLPAPSTAAQKLYSSAKNDILQVRTLLRSGRTQSSVGSGFLIGTSDLVITNYHVVSEFALDPDTYVGEWVDTGGRRGNLELLAIDVLHDLAVVRVNRTGTGFFKMPEHLATLTQGQYLYSLGNPLDLGFAISEGAYNGVITRSFYDQLMFTGPINAGMSGGPSVTVDGEIAGINVSKRLDGELVSFLVPARYAQELLKRVASRDKPPKDFKLVVAEQLLQHQQMMVDRMLATPLTLKSMGPYLVPVRDSDQMRCWGSSNDKADAQFMVDNASCAMESAVFISETLQTGQISIQHQFIRSNKLNAARFAELAGATFKDVHFGGNKDSRLTAPACTEQFVKNKTMPMRAVLCVRAYRKFAGLYNFALLTASTDNGLMSLQSRLDARGVSYDNGLRLSRAFMESISRGSKQ